MSHLCEDILTQIEIEVLMLYLITEMLMQISKLALIFMGLQAGEERGGAFLKVVSTT